MSGARNPASGMSAQALGALFVATFTLVLLATLPLSLVIATVGATRHDFSYERVSGTLWAGTVQGLRWRGMDLGEARFGFRPLALAFGRFGMDVVLTGKGAVTGQGFIALTPRGIFIRDLSVTADVRALPLVLPLTGNVSIDVARAEVGRAGCRVLDGAVQTDALVNRPAGLAWRGPVLSGPVGCNDGAIVIPLKGEAGAEVVAVMMTLARDGTFGIRIDASTPDPAVIGALSAVGFVEAGGMMTLNQRGRWS